MDIFDHVTNISRNTTKSVNITGQQIIVNRNRAELVVTNEFDNRLIIKTEQDLHNEV